jgi:hypothetical protein
LEAPWGYSIDVWNVGCMVRSPSFLRPLYGRVTMGL